MLASTFPGGSLAVAGVTALVIAGVGFWSQKAYERLLRGFEAGRTDETRKIVTEILSGHMIEEERLRREDIAVASAERAKERRRAKRLRTAHRKDLAALTRKIDALVEKSA